MIPSPARTELIGEPAANHKALSGIETLKRALLDAPGDRGQHRIPSGAHTRAPTRPEPLKGDAAGAVLNHGAARHDALDPRDALGRRHPVGERAFEGGWIRR